MSGCYNSHTLSLADIVKDVYNGRIGLPDLQRPFVWSDTQVRDLYDSMLKGYPVGYIMLWESIPNADDNRTTIGDNTKSFLSPSDLVIDGQQRLTALVATMYGVKVRDKNYMDREIRIAFNPLNCSVDVCTAVMKKDPQFISNVFDVFEAKRKGDIPSFRRRYIEAVNEYRSNHDEDPLTNDERDRIEINLDKLTNVENYNIPVLRILHDTEEEDVADIFVRVNSKGRNLNEDDFILTLISVYDAPTRDKIESFCRDSHIPSDESSYNSLITLSPSHIIRMTVGLAFNRAKLKYAYKMMRGRDLKLKETSHTTREQNFDQFRSALDKVTNLNDWHHFIHILNGAGFLNESMVPSNNTVVHSYVLYLKGRYEYGLDNNSLSNLIGRWFFMSTLTFYYTGSTAETVAERMYKDLESIEGKNQFKDYLERIMSSKLTNDFFSITHVVDLETTSTSGPAWNTYLASMVVLGRNLLFGNTPVSVMLIPGANGHKKYTDVHHIFPRQYLIDCSDNDNRNINQIANFALIDYQSNISISDRPPSKYVASIRESIGESEYAKTCEDNSLPINFENMDYREFLEARRLLMAKTVQLAFEKLSNDKCWSL